MRTPIGLLVAVAAVLLTACAADGQAAAGDGSPTATGETGATGAVEPAADDGTCSGFALSIPSGWTGRPTPREAAAWSAVHGGLDDRVPPEGWADAGTDESGARVRSGAWTLHVVQLPDGTWAVDSGTNC